MKHYTTSCYLANAIIDNVKIEAFIDFVKCKGWIEYEQERQDIKIFRYKKDTSLSGFHQITIPLDKSLADYNQAIFRALATLSRIYDMTIVDLIIRLSYVE
jgi:hypothetical protein